MNGCAPIVSHFGCLEAVLEDTKEATSVGKTRHPAAKHPETIFASQPGERAHSRFCPRTEPRIKSGTRIPSESSSSPSNNSFVSSLQEGKSSVRSMADNLHPIENFISQNRQMDKNSSTNSEPQIERGCAALSQDVALKLIDSTHKRP